MVEEELRLELAEKVKTVEELRLELGEKAKMIEKLKSDGVEMEHKLSCSMVEMERLKTSLNDKMGKLEAAEAKLTKYCNNQKKARGALRMALEMLEELEEGLDQVEYDDI